MMDVNNAVELLFDAFIYDVYPQVSSFSLNEEETKPGRYKYTLTIFIDINMVDFNINESIVIEDYHFSDPEYDYDVSEYIYDTLTSEIKESIEKCLRLINMESNTFINFIFKY